jgi:N,N'-diacetyllegionaminate synthase
MQKSLVAACSIAKGQIISESDLTQKRPGTGLAPIWADQIIGKIAKRSIAQNELFSLESIQLDL